MLRNLRSRRRPRYGAQLCAVISALLLLFSVSLLYSRLSLSSKPHIYPQHSSIVNDVVFPSNPLLSDSDDDVTTTTSTATATTKDDKIDELDIVEDNDTVLIEEDNNNNEIELEEEQEMTSVNHKDKIFSSGHFYFDHLTGSIKRSFNKRSIEDWDYDGGFLNEGFLGEDVKIKAAFGSDDIPLDEEVRRKMSEVESVEDALLVKKIGGKKVNPLREKWGDWFDKKGDFLRRDRMFKSNLEVLNPLSNPLLQDPDGVGVTGLTRGDRMVQKWILSEFKKVPFTVKKPLGILEMDLKDNQGGESKKNDNARNVLSKRENSGSNDLSSSTNANESNIRKKEVRSVDPEADQSKTESRTRKNEVESVKVKADKSKTEFSDHIYADGRRWGYYPGLDPRLSFSDFMDAFFRKGKCNMRVFMVWNSPPWMHSVRHQRGLESLLAQHRDACVVVFSETLDLDFFKDSFVKDGYKVAVAMPNLDELLNGTPTHIFASVWFEWRKTKFYATHYSELVRLAALYKYGGIYLDSDIIVLKPLLGLNNSVGLEDQLARSSLNGAVMAFRKRRPILILSWEDTLSNLSTVSEMRSQCLRVLGGRDDRSPFIKECLKEFYMTYDDTQLRSNGADLLTRVAKRFSNKNDILIKQPELKVQPSFVFFPIGSQHITSLTFHATYLDRNRYFVAPMRETEKAEQDALFKKILAESMTFHFWNSLTSSLIPEPQSLVARVIDYSCIHCSDVL
ncbi:hypothetical protein COLO4_30993 [Corchorus olitorius]|uniref:Alpha 1,4-glycosyltransferase domain-containing protein n=1 Tax=Corchorus olitorius TaxID=93759 RepID=A0A1R3H641_9ROSI|nr:hypothetical protein COLO4_30993 [Corchorus olitorius]